MHVLVWLDGLAPEALPALVAEAARREVHLPTVDEYYMKPPSRAGLLMGYTLLSEQDIAEGVHRLTEVLAALR